MPSRLTRSLQTGLNSCEYEVKTANMNVKKIFLTVDTECHDIQKLNRYIYGNTKKGPYGLEKILQLGKETNVPINIFLDFPECHVYGDDYLLTIIELVKKYEQNIYLHVHPDYIGDPKRKHLWEYSKDEQKKILKQSFSDYIRFCGKPQVLYFRAGAWGVNKDTYDVLSELSEEFEINEIVDLSYVYNSRWRCHLSYEEYGAANASRKYNGITLFPNTTYIGLDYFGKKYSFEFAVPNKSLAESKSFLRQNQLNNITYTMHSWDFIKRWFFLPDVLGGDDLQIKQFKKCVDYARRNGYEFYDLHQYSFFEEEDQCLNLCTGIIGKAKCLWYNYLRFADIGRSFKKYAPLYFLPYLFLFVLVIIILIIIS